MDLPFLKERKLPRVAKQVGESRYGFSEDDDLVESAAEEILQAFESKDHSRFMSALQALISLIRNQADADAPEDT